MQLKEQYSFEPFENLFFVKSLSHVLHFLVIYAAAYLHFLEQNIFLFPDFEYLRLNSVLQTSQLSTKPLHKGILCH